MTKLMIPFLTVLLCFHCSKESVKETTENSLNENYKLNTLLKKITDINEKSPDSFQATFTINGKFQNKKKFKSMGNALFNKKPMKIKVTFIDFVFKSPITVFVQDGRVLKFYFPVDKKLFIDDSEQIELRNYININVNFNFLSMLVSGKIPLIENYKIMQSITSKEEINKKTGGVFLILENQDYFETISFKNEFPDKILLINKTTKEKIEFYLENPSNKNGILSYSDIKFISNKTGDKIILKFSKKIFNKPLNVKSITYLQTSSKTKVIKVH